LCCFFKLKVSHLRGNCVCSLFCRVQAILVSTRYERSARTYTQLLDKRIRYNSAEHAPCIFLRLHGLFFAPIYGVWSFKRAASRFSTDNYPFSLFQTLDCDSFFEGSPSRRF
jgi:hypothetical protein